MITAKKLEPNVQTALLYNCVINEAASYCKKCGAEALHPLFWTIKDDLIMSCMKEGTLLRPWTVDLPEYMEKMLAAKVDSIITNYPDVALSLLK
jgi:glycerophosphoryl diester phosphodiesterase